MKKNVDYQRLTIQPSTKRDDDPMFPSDKHCFDSSGCISRRCQCHWNGRLSDLGHLPRKLATSWCQGWSPMKHGLWRRNVWGVLFCWIQDLLSKSQDVFRLIMINLDYIYIPWVTFGLFFAFFNMYLFFRVFQKKRYQRCKKGTQVELNGNPLLASHPKSWFGSTFSMPTGSSWWRADLSWLCIALHHQVANQLWWIELPGCELQIIIYLLVKSLVFTF